MRVRMHGNRVVKVLDNKPANRPSKLTLDQLEKYLSAAEYRGVQETMPEKVSVAEIIQRNEWRWLQMPAPSPAKANTMEAAGLRALNARNKQFWEEGVR